MAIVVSTHFPNRTFIDALEYRPKPCIYVGTYLQRLAGRWAIQLFPPPSPALQWVPLTASVRFPCFQAFWKAVARTLGLLFFLVLADWPRGPDMVWFSPPPISKPVEQNEGIFILFYFFILQTDTLRAAQYSLG